jgi:hypothetical protein
MGVMTKDYRVSVRFCRKIMIFAKTLGQHIWIFSENLIFFKTHKNLNMGPLCITYLEYVGHVQEIWSFGKFLPQTGDFFTKS